MIESEHGEVGVISFSASASAVAARDERIGWMAERRHQRRHSVLGLSRFLILPSVRCQLLAYKVLGRILRRLPEDFRQRYGYRPALVETYSDLQQHAGTCSRAANRIHLGQTRGCGNLDTHHQYNEPCKSVFVKPLCRDWEAILNR